MTSKAALYDYDPPHKYRCGECGETLTGYELEDIEVEIENHQISHEFDRYGRIVQGRRLAASCFSRQLPITP